MILVVTAFLGLSKPAQAGIFGNLAGVFLAARPIIAPASNSQTIAILEAALTSDPRAAGTGGGDTTIVGGQALLPDIGPLGTIADISNLPKNDQISIYVVRPGDTLSQIASMFEVSVNTILWANDLRRNSPLKTGQIITILPISGISHTVAKGDTLKNLARRYHGDLEEIARFNDLGIGETLVIGTVVIIPDGELVGSPNFPPSSGPLPATDGYYLRPIVGGLRTQGLHGYLRNAIDLATYQGAPIFAAADGVVIISRTGGWNGGYGNYVVIQHPNGTQTLYSHNQENLVRVGDRVVRGSTIATVGQTGKVTGPHVHFEVRGARNPF